MNNEYIDEAAEIAALHAQENVDLGRGNPQLLSQFSDVAQTLEPYDTRIAGPTGAGGMGDLSEYFKPEPVIQPTSGPILAPEGAGGIPGIAPRAPSGVPSAPAAQDVSQSTMAPTPQMAMNKVQLDSLAASEKAIKNAASIQSDTYKQEAQAWKDYATKAAALEQESQKREAPIRQRGDELYKGLNDGTIDHNRLWSNTSAGNKVLATIGVLLSGLGAGLQGPGAKNMAMENIQKSIDRDIDAQKAELGKKQTLFSENMRLLGDERAATLATKANLLAGVQAKVQSMSAQRGSADSTLKAHLLMQELSNNRKALEQKAAALNMAAQGGGLDPAALVPQLVPESHQKAVFEEVQRAQDTRRMGTSILKAFDDAAEENTVFKTGAGLIRTPGSVYALHQAMQPTFKDLEGTVRQAAMDNTFKNITPAPGDLDSTIKQKRKALEEYLQSKASAPTAKGFGIDLDKFKSTTTTRPQTKISGGITYMRGPNGEAIPVK